MAITWTQRGSTLNGGTAGDQFGRSAAVSLNGLVMAIGAQLYQSAGTAYGGVYIYDISDSTYTLRGSVLLASDKAANDQFGSSVSLNGDGTVLAVGANNWEGGAGTNRGGVYIFDISGSTYTQRGSVLEAGDAADSDNFGIDVRLSTDGEVLLVGANNWEGAAGTNRGGIYVYDRNGSSWTQRGSVLEASDAADSDNFGRSVSMTQDQQTIAVGANNWEGAAGTNRGGVYVYDKNGTGWTQRGSVLEAGDAADSDLFGVSNCLQDDGNRLVVGASNWEGGAGTNRGGIYTYDRNGSSWTQNGSVLEGSADNITFGVDVALNHHGNVLITGANLTANGSAYVYDTSEKGIGAIVSAYTDTTQTVNLTAQRTLPITSSTYTLSLIDTAILRQYPMPVTTGTYTLSLIDVILTANIGPILTVDASPYSLSLKDIGLTVQRNILADVSSYILTSNNTGLYRGYPLIIDANSYTLSLIDANFSRSYALTTDLSTYTLSGIDTNLLYDRIFPVDLSTYSLSLIDLILSFGYSFIVDSSNYSLSLIDSNFNLGFTFPISTLSFTEDNKDVRLIKDSRIVIDTSTISDEYIDTTLDYDRNYVIDVAPYTLSNKDISLLTQRYLNSGLSTYSLTLNDTNLSISARIFSVDPLTFNLSLKDIGLLKSSKLIIEPSSYLLTLRDTSIFPRFGIVADKSEYLLTNNSVNLIKDSRLPVSVSNYLLSLNDTLIVHKYDLQSNMLVIATQASPTFINIDYSPVSISQESSPRIISEDTSINPVNQ